MNFLANSSLVTPVKSTHNTESPLTLFLSPWTPDRNISLFSCSILYYDHQLVVNFVCLPFGDEQLLCSGFFLEWKTAACCIRLETMLSGESEPKKMWWKMRETAELSDNCVCSFVLFFLSSLLIYFAVMMTFLFIYLYYYMKYYILYYPLMEQTDIYMWYICIKWIKVVLHLSSSMYSSRGLQLLNIILLKFNTNYDWL